MLRADPLPVHLQGSRAPGSYRESLCENYCFPAPCFVLPGAVPTRSTTAMRRHLGAPWPLSLLAVSSLPCPEPDGDYPVAAVTVAAYDVEALQTVGGCSTYTGACRDVRPSCVPASVMRARLNTSKKAR